MVADKTHVHVVERAVREQLGEPHVECREGAVVDGSAERATLEGSWHLTGLVEVPHVEDEERGPVTCLKRA